MQSIFQAFVPGCTVPKMPVPLSTPSHHSLSRVLSAANRGARRRPRTPHPQPNVGGSSTWAKCPVHIRPKSDQTGIESSENLSVLCQQHPDRQKSTFQSIFVKGINWKIVSHTVPAFDKMQALFGHLRFLRVALGHANSETAAPVYSIP